jgi:hypothetical protein
MPPNDIFLFPKLKNTFEGKILDDMQTIKHNEMKLPISERLIPERCTDRKSGISMYMLERCTFKYSILIFVDFILIPLNQASYVTHVRVQPGCVV